MSGIGAVSVETTVVLGTARMTIRELLTLSRGAMIAFPNGCDEPSELRVEGTPIARGRILVTGEKIALEVTELVEKKL